MDVMSRLEIVKRPSAPIGLKKLAMKAQAQYDHLGFAIAIRMDATIVGIDVKITIQFPCTR